MEAEEESTDVKLAMLASLYTGKSQDALLEVLLSCDGSVEQAMEVLATEAASPRKKAVLWANGPGYQSSIASFGLQAGKSPTSSVKRPLTRKGKTLYLYSPEDIEAHTPCSIIHNFLPKEEADALLLELLEEAPSFQKETFKLFDNVVQSPHTMCFYVDSWDEAERQKTEYVYNGNYVKVIDSTTLS
jgi:hypothetical protein